MSARYLIWIALFLFCAGCTGPNSPQAIGEEVTHGLARTGQLLEDVGDDVAASIEGQDTTDRHEFVDDGTHYEYKRPQPERVEP